MVRALITISEKDLRRLDRLARKNKRSRADLVREALGEYLQKKAKEPTWKELVKQCAGMWEHKGIDGLEYERKLREEWDR